MCRREAATYSLKAVVQKTKVSLFCCLILWLKKSFSAVVEPAPRIRLYFCSSKCKKRAIACPRPAPTLLGQRGQLPPLPPWLRRPWVQTCIMMHKKPCASIYYNCGERHYRQLIKYIGKLPHFLLLLSIHLGYMALPTVLVLGHSYVWRLKSDLLRLNLDR